MRTIEQLYACKKRLLWQWWAVFFLLVLGVLARSPGFFLIGLVWFVLVLRTQTRLSASIQSREFDEQNS
ncbi:MAG: hypothetical protein ACMXYD_05390 [Candidatus Woesearchaeota archaeon]